MNIKSAYIKARNALHSGYGECSRCGGNWGWKKNTTHPTSDNSGIFLFCEDCDKVVTLTERWEALDGWKATCIRQIGIYYKADPAKKVLDATRDIMNTELLEFPREVVK